MNDALTQCQVLVLLASAKWLLDHDTPAFVAAIDDAFRQLGQT